MNNTPSIPDRMSADVHSEYYHAECGFVRVFLDDIEQAKCVEYCISEGWIIRAKRDDTGASIIAGDEFVTEKVTGNVKAQWA